MSGIEPPVIESIYINGAPDAKYAKINYILNRYRDGLYSTSVDYRHIQIAIWAIMEGYLDWSWRSASGISPEVPYGDKALVEISLQRPTKTSCPDAAMWYW